MSTTPTTGLTLEKLNKVYRMLVEAQAQTEAEAEANGYYVLKCDRFPRSRKRRIRRKWLRDGRSFRYVWMPAGTPVPNPSFFLPTLST